MAMRWLCAETTILNLRGSTCASYAQYLWRRGGAPAMRAPSRRRTCCCSCAGAGSLERADAPTMRGPLWNTRARGLCAEARCASYARKIKKIADLKDNSHTQQWDMPI